MRPCTVRVSCCRNSLAPWTGRSIPELSKNIKNIPLKFFDEKVQVSENMKEFLRGCLQADESKRLSWQEIIQEPLFLNNFPE
jgi:calcium-dependent protein kinase